MRLDSREMLMTPHKKTRLFIKRAFDLIFSFTFLVILSPLLAAVAGAVWISMGPPIFFRQGRLGQHGQPFTILKFRTMNEERDPEGNLLPNQERITKLGHFLRRTTLDELPELFNVLKGEMSIVGPRPLIIPYRDLYTEEQWRRHELPPGMAGPVLADGRNALTWEEKFARDTWYVDNWSLWLDLKILAQTAVQVVQGKGISAEGHATMPRFAGSKGESETEADE